MNGDSYTFKGLPFAIFGPWYNETKTYHNNAASVLVTSIDISRYRSIETTKKMAYDSKEPKGIFYFENCGRYVEMDIPRKPISHFPVIS